MRPPNVTLEATGQVETHRVGEKIDLQKKHGREVGSLEDLKTRGDAKPFKSGTLDSPTTDHAAAHHSHHRQPGANSLMKMQPHRVCTRGSVQRPAPPQGRLRYQPASSGIFSGASVVRGSSLGSRDISGPIDSRPDPPTSPPPTTALHILRRLDPDSQRSRAQPGVDRPRQSSLTCPAPFTSSSHLPPPPSPIPPLPPPASRGPDPSHDTCGSVGRLASDPSALFWHRGYRPPTHHTNTCLRPTVCLAVIPLQNLTLSMHLFPAALARSCLRSAPVPFWSQRVHKQLIFKTIDS